MFSDSCTTLQSSYPSVIIKICASIVKILRVHLILGQIRSFVRVHSGFRKERVIVVKEKKIEPRLIKMTKRHAIYFFGK